MDTKVSLTTFESVFIFEIPGVFFELLATDMRHPPLKTYEDILEQNFTIIHADNDLGIVARQLKSLFDNDPR